MRILVADDEEMIRELIRVTLSADERFEVATAGDGVSAVRLVQEWVPDLVLLDVRMPGMTGVEVCQWVRDHELAVQPRIIMLSAMTQTADIDAGLGAGADDYFTKPFSPMALLGKVYEVAEVAA